MRAIQKRRQELLVQRVDHVTGLCVNRDVLHLGCTNWPYAAESDANGHLLHRTISAVASRCVGFDSDAAGISALEALGFTDLVVGDVERLDELKDIGQFDVVLAGEIIEHLGNPERFLTAAAAVLRPGGVLVVTTVNAYCAFRFVMYALRGKGGEQEPVHPDHVAYYSRSTLTLALNRTGWNVRDFRYYDMGREHRPFNSRWIRIVNDVAVRIAPHLGDGVIAVCARDEN
jgi:SAM-dependent methyltransferase